MVGRQIVQQGIRQRGRRIIGIYPGLNLAQGLTEGISDGLGRKLGLRPEMVRLTP
jgi:hypothetical protein